MLATRDNGHAASASGSASGGPDSNTAHSIYKTDLEVGGGNQEPIQETAGQVGTQAGAQSQEAQEAQEAQAPMTVVGTHMDWLACSSTVDMSDERRCSFYDALGESNGEPVETDLEIFGLPLVLRPTLGGELVLRNEYLYLETQSLGEVKFSVTVYSRPFWDIGEVTVVEQLQRFVDNLCGVEGGQSVALKPSRVDLCRDVQNFDLDRFGDRKALRQFVTRQRHLLPVIVDEHVQTVYLGLAGGKVRVRMYNKSLELKKSKKDYYTPTWEAHGYDPLRDVKRIEFEMRRDFFAHWEVEGVGQVDTIQQLLAALNGIWQYLMRRHTRMIVPDAEETNVSRLVTHADWEVLAGPYMPDLPDVAGERVKRYSPQRERACKQLFGSFKTVCALTPGGTHYTQEEYERGLVHEFRRLITQEGVPFVGEVHKRDLKIRAWGSGKQKTAA